jgi:predicted anti-sigma-YlaC factor YlaD
MMGTFPDPRATCVDVDCDIAREALSASLDGEDPGTDGGTDSGTDTAEVDRHVAGCPACAAWYERAAAVDRLVRVGVAPPAGPDLADLVLARVTLPRRGRWHQPLSVALVVVAIAQLALGLSSLFSPPIGMPADAAGAHMEHESAAFNLAFGVVLLLVGLNSGRARAHIPGLATFVAVLALASMVDLADGAVAIAREATHIPVIIGLVLAVALSRQPQARPGPDRHARRPAGADLDPVREPEFDRSGEAPSRVHRDRPPAARRDVA